VHRSALDVAPPADVKTEPFHGFAAEQCSRYEALQVTLSGERRWDLISSPIQKSSHEIKNTWGWAFRGDFWYRNWATKNLALIIMDTYPCVDLERCIFGSNQLLGLTLVLLMRLKHYHRSHLPPELRAQSF